MKIANDTAVSIHYLVRDSEGTDIDSSFDGEPLKFIQGKGFLIPGLEQELNGKEAGETFTCKVAAADAYGERLDGYVQDVPKSMFEGFEDQLQVGMQLRAGTEEGEQTVIVVGIDEETVTVDGNHPLAGLDLEFDVEIVDVRKATEEEIASGQIKAASSCCSSNDDCCGSKH